MQITSGMVSQLDSNQERTLLCSLYTHDAFKSFNAFTYPSVLLSLSLDEGAQAHFLSKVSRSSASTLLRPL